jgi:hypothetical protein
MEISFLKRQATLANRTSEQKEVASKRMSEALQNRIFTPSERKRITENQELGRKRISEFEYSLLSKKEILLIKGSSEGSRVLAKQYDIKVNTVSFIRGKSPTR